MVAPVSKPQNTEERLVWYSLVFLYPWYAIGALYLVGPLLAWSLFLLYCYRLYQRKINAPLTLTQQCWLWGMLMMLLCLVIGHLQFDIGSVQLIKSTLGWAKGWAIIAIFILCGAMQIRFEMLVRACMWLCGQTLCLIPLFIAAWLIGGPSILYVSPLQIIGGPGPEFFAVSLYEIDPGSGLPRWRLFTPWAPALGLMANLYLIMAFEERDVRWRMIGIIAAVMMILMSQSRLALLCMCALCAARYGLPRLNANRLALLLTLLCLCLALFAVPLLELGQQLYETFRNARADSTRVRDILARIAIMRWQSEAPWFGHGVVERGPHLVEYMPIGSHHTWYGLLFIKGLIGLCSLLLPMLVSIIRSLFSDIRQPLHRATLLCLITLGLYTFGENLEILAYLFWPALLIIGTAHAESLQRSDANRSSL